MDFRIVERKTTKGKPTWYFYGPTGYIGALFMTDQETADALHERLCMGSDTNNVGIKFVTGPDFGESVS